MELKPGYTQTEVGLIPEVWTVVSLGFTARGIYRGASPRPIENPIWFDDTSKVGWVRISDVTRSGRQLVETTQRLSKEGIQKSRFIPSGSLIMSICATVGRPIETQIDVCIHDGFVVFDHPLIDQGYLYHVLKDLEPRWSSKGQTGSQMNLNGDLIKSTLIPLPPTKAEQESIAEALSDADALIESLDQLIAKKRQIKQGAMQELLTGKRRLPGFSGEWEVVQAGDIGYFKGGSGFPTRFQGGKSGEYPFYKVSDMNIEGNEIFMKNANNYIDDGLRRQVGATSFPANSIVFAKVGAAVFLERKKILSQASCLDNNMAALILDDTRADFRFIHFVLLNKNLGNLVSATALPSLSNSVLATIELVLPPRAEQTAIATILSDMDCELAALESRLAKARKIKQGMMHELLTGRIRLI